MSQQVQLRLNELKSWIECRNASKLSPVPIVDSADVERMKQLGAEHTRTGCPVLIRHKPLLDRIKEGVEVDDLSGMSIPTTRLIWTFR